MCLSVYLCVYLHYLCSLYLSPYWRYNENQITLMNPSAAVLNVRPYVAVRQYAKRWFLIAKGVRCSVRDPTQPFTLYGVTYTPLLSAQWRIRNTISEMEQYKAPERLCRISHSRISEGYYMADWIGSISYVIAVEQSKEGTIMDK